MVGDETRAAGDQVERWEAEVREARHQMLTQRDHIIGTEAAVARLTTDNAKLRREVNRTRKQLANVRGKLRAERAASRQLRQRLTHLRAELEAARQRPSLSRRVARKVLGRGR